MPVATSKLKEYIGKELRKHFPEHTIRENKKYDARILSTCIKANVNIKDKDALEYYLSHKEDIDGRVERLINV